MIRTTSRINITIIQSMIKRLFTRRDFMKIAALGVGAIADLAGSEDVQSVHLAEMLHASRSSKVHEFLRIFDLNLISVNIRA